MTSDPDPHRLLAHRQAQLALSALTLVRHLTRRLIMIAVREAMEMAVSSLIGGLLAWQLGHR